MHPKDTTGPVFACPTKVLCGFLHDLCVNSNSVSTYSNLDLFIKRLEKSKLTAMKLLFRVSTQMHIIL